MNAAAPELMVVMPVFNEQASVRKVVLEWFAEIENWTEDFVFLALDDGSTDDTPRLLARLHEQLGARFEWRSRANRGHGQTCIEGYRDACERGARFVFQIDSDGQCDPQFFFRLWRLRGKCDVVYGSRVKRDDGWRRVAASLVLPHVKFGQMIYTGPVDEFFDCQFGPLPYRSLRFEPETLEQEFFQPAMQVNYPNDHDFTRIVEIKHATGQRLPVTTIVREYPDDYGPGREPYYPIPAPDTKALYDRYAALAETRRDVSFIGRLATYRYYNMDQVVGMALAEFERLRIK
jgi:glycosyltransferase involved in cell wall biosynthesis